MGIKKFKKGDLVTVISNWDSKGTVTYRHAIVHSCGPKRMTLFCETYDDCMGRNFRPDGGVFSLYSPLILHRLPDDEAKERCMEIARAVIKSEKDRFSKMLSEATKASHVEHYATRIAELHEPRACNYHGVCEFNRL